jgi:glycosyltransferase involved in cell wall biosynthesis
MNILLCLPYEISDPKGNSIAARRLAQGFRTAGHQVTLLDWPGVANPQQVRDTIAAARPQVCLLLHAWRCATAFHLIQREAGIPTVVALRGTDLNEMLDDPATRAQITAVLESCRAITVFHLSGKESLIARDSSWEAKIRVIPNGGALGASQVDYRARLGMPADAFVLVSVAGLREVKRPALVIPWLAELRRDCRPRRATCPKSPGWRGFFRACRPRRATCPKSPGWRGFFRACPAKSFGIGGSKAEKHGQRATYPPLALAHAGPPLEAATTAEFARLRDRFPWIYHLDGIPHDEMDSFLRCGQVFVAASRSEGMPHAVREAMLCGLPLLLSDIPGHRQMAHPEREALFFADEEGFKQQIRRLWHEPAAFRRDLGARARERAEKELAQNDEIALYLEVLHQLIAEGAAT